MYETRQVCYYSQIGENTKRKGVPFVDGFPTIPQNMLAREMPNEILPFPNHLKAKNPARALLTNFSNEFFNDIFSFGLFEYAAGEPSAVEVRSYFGTRFLL